MDASVQQMATPAWLAANIKGDMSLTPLQYIGVDPDALRLWFTPDQYFNWSHFTDPALTKLIADGQQELDPAKRLADLRPSAEDHHGPGDRAAASGRTSTW